MTLHTLITANACLLFGSNLITARTSVAEQAFPIDAGNVIAAIAYLPAS